MILHTFEKIPLFLVQLFWGPNVYMHQQIAISVPIDTGNSLTSKAKYFSRLNSGIEFDPYLSCNRIYIFGGSEYGLRRTYIQIVVQVVPFPFQGSMFLGFDSHQ